jgi:hypothetical protein
MPLAVSCPNCDLMVQVPDSAAGRNVQCNCGTLYNIAPPLEPDTADWSEEAFQPYARMRRKPREVLPRSKKTNNNLAIASVGIALVVVTAAILIATRGQTEPKRAETVYVRPPKAKPVELTLEEQVRRLVGAGLTVEAMELYKRAAEDAERAGSSQLAAKYMNDARNIESSLSKEEIAMYSGGRRPERICEDCNGTGLNYMADEILPDEYGSLSEAERIASQRNSGKSKAEWTVMELLNRNYQVGRNFRETKCPHCDGKRTVPK